MPVAFKGGLAATDLMNGGARFRVVVARAAPILRVVTPAFLEGNMGDAWDKLRTPYIYPVSPRPLEKAKTTAIDVKVKHEQRGVPIASVLNDAQSRLGIWSELVSIEPLQPADISVTRAPSERAAAEAEAEASGAGASLAQRAGETFSAAFSKVRGLLVSALVIGGVGLVAVGVMRRGTT